MKIAACYCVHDDASYLSASLDSFSDSCERVCFVSRISWHDRPGDWQHAQQVAEKCGATVVVGEWRSELEHRRAAIEYLVKAGFTHALIPDGDEIIEPALLNSLCHVAEAGIADRVYVHWDTYWKSPEYIIRPREQFRPCILVELRAAIPTGGRNFEGGRPLLLGPEHGIIHHLSYVGPDERIRRKITTWGHTNEVVHNWYENVWRAWDSDKLRRNLHPTHPSAYGFAERVRVPDILRPAMERFQEIAGEPNETSEPIQIPDNPNAWPKVSIVIPLHGGAQDIRQCLEPEGARPHIPGAI